MLDAELLQVLNQIPGAIEKAFAAFIERHPGHGSQKVHGHRQGSGGLTEEQQVRTSIDKKTGMESLPDIDDFSVKTSGALLEQLPTQKHSDFYEFATGEISRVKDFKSKEEARQSLASIRGKLKEERVKVGQARDRLRLQEDKLRSKFNTIKNDPNKSFEAVMLPKRIQRTKALGDEWSKWYVSIDRAISSAENALGEVNRAK